MFAPTLALLAAPLLIQSEPYTESGLTVTLEAFDSFTGGPVGEHEVRARWSGEAAGTQFSLALWSLSREDYGIEEPADVLNVVQFYRNKSQLAEHGSPFAFDTQEPLEGAYGYLSYAWLGENTRYEDTRAVESYLCLGGLLKDQAYALEISTTPPLTEQSRAIAEELFGTVLSYDGELADVDWSDEEVEARWARDAPDRVLEDSKLMVVRSKHYLIMTNVGKGTAKGFGKKIDECYERIREVYPFEDVEGQRLMPIFYFVTPDQYYEWYAKNLDTTVERASRSGGVSFGDVYSTYHQATNAPVHIHEATHQIFKARMHLGGGGSWFQEGVAEYMSSTGTELGLVKGIAKRERQIPFRDFFKLSSLLYSSEADRKSGGSAAGDAYAQAAAVIEFMRHGPHEEHFQEFIHAMGRVSRNDVDAIETQLRGLLGRDIDGLEEDFVKYWTKRRKPKKK